jgi:signal transduction histidine kinase
MNMVVGLEQPDLMHVLQTYNDVTARLMRSHEMLSREVCRLRDELHEKNEQLRRNERLAALGEMAAGVAHEIRNPLGGMNLYASLLERDLADLPGQQELTRRIQRGIQSLDAIVGDILAFAGEVRPRICDVNLRDILTGAVAQLQPRVVHRKLRIECDPDLDPLGVQCDPGQVERALVNLLMNAADAVPEGGLVRVCHAGFADDGALLLVAVQDSGPGIDPGLLQRVFNPFFTTKHTGTGLGLAIVHRIAEANGGYITAGNRAEGGAVFTLALPTVGRPDKQEG